MKGCARLIASPDLLLVIIESAERGAAVAVATAGLQGPCPSRQRAGPTNGDGWHAVVEAVGTRTLADTLSGDGGARVGGRAG